MSRAYYSHDIHSFLLDNPSSILGKLTANHPFDLTGMQRDAWLSQIDILKDQLQFLDEGQVLFEYAIPRMGKRVDNILLYQGLIFVIEFKVGENRFTVSALDQVTDYALDLKNFHEQSHSKPIIPIVLATEGPSTSIEIIRDPDQVFHPLKANKQNLGSIISQIISTDSTIRLDYKTWEESMYKPTPTIIEAAQALYQNHKVEEITRSDAGAKNLSDTSQAIYEVIELSQENDIKSICFITGVPGAGKTLAGLKIATKIHEKTESKHAVFLSGNGPLVKVLNEALAKDEVENALLAGVKINKKASLRKIQQFIQNIHRFRDDAIESASPPDEHIVIFDEAQRAWTLEQTSAFMRRKRGKPNFNQSEPDFLIGVMDRHKDWAVIICLVGGGQEINTGEAGILEWFKALQTHYPHWKIFVSRNLSDGEYLQGNSLDALFTPDQITTIPDLHLSVSLRSFRSEKVSAFVKAVLDQDISTAQELYKVIHQSYPIVLTRDLEKAKEWVKQKARGTERYGLLASSGAYRLRPIGINVQAEVGVENWFLNGKDDVRSSYYLEETATEFDIQGLEIDWACVAWDADFRYSRQGWEYWAFRGSKWQRVGQPTRQRYLMNAYRVLLTRARQGMVITVPEGNLWDHTRTPEHYDGTYHFLRSVGIDEI